MFRKLFSIALAAALVAGIAAAQDKKESGLGDWLKGIQKKLDSIIPKKQPTVTTGVAGIRGAKEEGRAKLYWKGKKGDEPVTEEELLEFKTGVDLASKGEKQAALRELEEFMQQFPDSALIPDAKKTLDLVKAEGK